MTAPADGMRVAQIAHIDKYAKSSGGDVPPGQAVETLTPKEWAQRVLAYLDMPTLGQPEAFVHAKDVLFDADGNIGEASRAFLQGWMDKYVAWVKRHNA